ncbi:MAG: quinohemoprotein amine dehydrogenase subunit beta [Pseudomonas sp.]
MLKNNKKTWVAGAVLATVMAAPALADNAGRALQSGQEYMVVTNYPNNLHVVDIATDRVYKSCDLPDQFGPGTPIISPDGSRAYVLSNRYSTVYGIELDSCDVSFRAVLAQKPGELARSMYSFAVSTDGKELYTVANPSQKNLDHYVVGDPRLQIYNTGDGLDAKPVRIFSAPRQSYLMQAADDGSLYLAADNIYKIDVQTGEREMAIGIRDAERKGYGQADVLYLWPKQQVSRDFTILYAAPKFIDETENMDTAEFMFGFYNINLETCKIEIKDFAPFTEVYFTGARSPKDSGVMYAVLNRLTKYDIETQELLDFQELDHTYYVLAFNHAGDKLYLAGTFNDIGIHDPETLEKVGSITLPGGDMSTTTPQIFIR